MKTISDSRLPFTMQIPDGCEVKSGTLTKEPSITVIRRSPKFFLDLTWGKSTESSGYSPPPKYKLIERHQIRTNGSSTTLLVARSSLFSGATGFIFLMISFFQGLIAALVSLLFLWILEKKIAFAIPIGLAAVALSWIYIAVKIGPTIKYAFIFGGQEFVFTGSLRQRAEVEKCVQSIKFQPEGES